MQTRLSAGTNVATSATITVAGTPVKVGLFVASGAVPKDCSFDIHANTPGAGNYIGRLGGAGDIEAVIAGDGEYVIVRRFVGASGVGIGVYSSEE